MVASGKGCYNLENLKIQYKDYVMWQKEELSKREFEKQKNYWLSVYNDEIPVLNIKLSDSELYKGQEILADLIKNDKKNLRRQINEYKF